MIGLGTMGRNFLLNVAEHGFPCVGFDIDVSKRRLLLEEGQGLEIAAAEDVREFVASLEKPRRIMLLVPAGQIVDSVIDDLMPHLEKSDIVIDGGNSHFRDTDRRGVFLNAHGFEFLGVGVSGGEEGARHGASIMVGGTTEAYELVRPIFESAAAKVDGEPCAAHVGKGSAGHFVKMVHNGIEYGMMQLIAEAYDLLKRGNDLTELEIADLFLEWNSGQLNSFLIEITSIVLRRTDEKTGKPLVEMILDTAGQKGTGKWTTEAAMELGVPIPTIDSAVTMRQISARKTERVEAARKIGNSSVDSSDIERSKEESLGSFQEALHLAFLVTFAQGLSLLKAASAEKNYELDLGEITKIWRGGCIIRATLLNDIRAAVENDPAMPNILHADSFRDLIREKFASLKDFVNSALSINIPCLSAASSLNYLLGMTTERLPANLIQAQRDHFGAHTYQRIDEEGTFHTPDW